MTTYCLYICEKLCYSTHWKSVIHAWIQRVLSEGVQILSSFFTVMKGYRGSKYHYKWYQGNPISMTYHWWANDEPTLNAGLVAL